MERLVVLGANGMLGEAVTWAALERGLPVFALSRLQLDLRYQNHRGWADLCQEDTVINCAGIVRQLCSESQPETVLRVNAVAPHEVAWRCGRLLQVSTDCVFNGNSGPYSETSQPTPTDLYGVSKLAGEVTYERHLTVRTSFIGLSRHGKGLLDWFLSQPQGASVPGWNVMWSGYYVKELAPLLVNLALDESRTGLLHLRGHYGTKARLLGYLADRVRPDITIVADTSRYQNFGLKSADPYQDGHSKSFWEMVGMIADDYQRRTGRVAPEAVR